jgi:hypothetical protein
MGITEAQYTARFCHPVQTGRRLTCTARRKFETAAQSRPNARAALWTRLVGAFAAGTIINPRLVRSQYYGGMIWGVSFALHERAVLDPRSGRVMNANLAEYHVPVN